jgi:uncharacterized small protein (DUF1192 family)
VSTKLTDKQIAEGLEIASMAPDYPYPWDALCAAAKVEMTCLALQERLQAAEAERDTRITDLVDEVDRLKAERDEARKEAERARDHFLDRIVGVHQQARREAFEEARGWLSLIATEAHDHDQQGPASDNRFQHIEELAGQAIRALAEVER